MAYGYKKSPDNPKQWVIDEPAAKVVRYIFQLCIEGLGVTEIARRLEAEKILTPTAYYNSIGRKTRNKIIDPYRWSENSVDHILCNMQYTGCTVNFKSSTVSFKVHKTVYHPEEDWVVIPNTQEAIIDMDTWERVQEIKKHRRRNTATGRQSIFSGLMYCGDCGSKLCFCAAKSVKEHQEFYRCSAYKENSPIDRNIKSALAPLLCLQGKQRQLHDPLYPQCGTGKNGTEAHTGSGRIYYRI